MAEKIVVVMGPESLALLQPGCSGFEDCVEEARGAEWLSLLRRLLGSGRENSVVYLGVDGVVPYLLGGRVVDVYGSEPRLRCPRCGRRWWRTRGERCPGCGAPGVPEAAGEGQPPPRRRLEEAIYEATSADRVLIHGLGEPPDSLGLLLALAASRFAEVAVAEPVPRLLRENVPGLAAGLGFVEALRLLLGGQ